MTERVTIAAVDASTVVLRDAQGNLKEVRAGAVGDPAEIRRVLSMDNWFTRLVDRLSWIFWC